MLRRVAQQVAHLQHQVAGAALLGQRVGLRQGGRHRLLDQHMPAGRHRLHGQLEVRLGGRGDDQGVAGCQQFYQWHCGGAAGLVPDCGGAGTVRVEQPGQHGAAAACHLQRMEPPEMPGAGDADSQWMLDHALL